MTSSCSRSCHLCSAPCQEAFTCLDKDCSFVYCSRDECIKVCALAFTQTGLWSSKYNKLDRSKRLKKRWKRHKKNPSPCPHCLMGIVNMCPGCRHHNLPSVETKDREQESNKRKRDPLEAYYVVPGNSKKLNQYGKIDFDLIDQQNDNQVICRLRVGKIPIPILSSTLLSLPSSSSSSFFPLCFLSTNISSPISALAELISEEFRLASPEDHYLDCKAIKTTSITPPLHDGSPFSSALVSTSPVDLRNWMSCIEQVFPDKSMVLNLLCGTLTMTFTKYNTAVLLCAGDILIVSPAEFESCTVTESKESMFVLFSRALQEQQK